FDSEWSTRSHGNEGGRSVSGRLNFGRKLVAVARDETSRINEEREIGTATCRVGGVDWRIGAAAVIAGKSGREMAAGREAENADTVWIDATFSGMMQYQDEGEMGIGQIRGMLRRA